MEAVCLVQLETGSTCLHSTLHESQGYNTAALVLQSYHQSTLPFVLFFFLNTHRNVQCCRVQTLSLQTLFRSSRHIRYIVHSRFPAAHPVALEHKDLVFYSFPDRMSLCVNPVDLLVFNS